MDAIQSPEPLRWPAGEKLEHMEAWSLNVMADVRLTKAALRIAWTLVFSFHSKDARAWETKEKLARRTGMSVSSIKSGLINLERAGHIIRVSEIVQGKRMRVIRPCMNSLVMEQAPRKRRGGKGSEPQSDIDGWWPEDETPKGSDLMTPKGFEDDTPCILEESLKNPGAVEDVAEGGRMDPVKKQFGLRFCECGKFAEYEDRTSGQLLCADCAPLSAVPLDA